MLDMGAIPVHWCGACITPVYKMGDEYERSCSRGIMLSVVMNLHGRVLITRVSGWN